MFLGAMATGQSTLSIYLVLPQYLSPLYLVLPQYLPPLCNSVEVAGSGDHVLRPQQGAKVDAEVRKCLREKKLLD